MKKLGLGLVIMAVGLLFYGSLATAQPAHSLALSAVDGRLLTATLLGANEVPPVVTAATGFANLVVKSDEICYEITVTGITDATAAHIHPGAAGVNGAPLVTLNTPDANGESNGCTTVAGGDITAILANPANYYINVHTPANPGGAIRGQLEVVPVLVAQLNGLNEMTGAGVPYQGDMDGTGSAVISLYEDQNLVCYELAFLGIATPTAAHIHDGDAYINGPVVVNFTQDGGGILNEGCAEDTNTVIADILTTPDDFYVNIHNADFPGGAIRGQLGNGWWLNAGLNGANEIPGPGDSDGEGAAVLNFDVVTAQICGGVSVNDIATATLGHIHTGAVGVSGGVVVNLNYTGSPDPFCVDAERQQILDILTNPTAYYVNVHNADFPAGAVRGQLFDMVPFNVVLSGENETNGTGGFGLGDPDGSGAGLFTVNGVQGRLCYLFQVNDIAAATASHVHEGTFDENGPVVITLQTPDGSGFSADCQELDGAGLGAGLQMLAFPDEYYVNVHTADFPAGAVRDQLTLAQTFDLGDAGNFALSAPKNNAYIRDAGAPNQFEWSAADNAVSYTLTLFQISNNARLGVVDTVTAAAADVCEAGECALDYSLDGLETGTYSWTVEASSLGGAGSEASNAAFLFKLNVDPIELGKNGGFEAPTANPTAATPANWKRVNPSGERRECSANKLPDGVSGACAYLGTTGPLAILTQNVAQGLLNKLKIAPGDTLTVNANVQAANAVPAKSKIRILLQFAGGKKQTINVTLDAASGDVFAAITPSSTEIGVNKAVVKKMTVQIVSGSKFFIDDISVILEPVAPVPLTLIPLPGSPTGDLRGQ